VVVVSDRRNTGGVKALVVRLREYLLDAHLPVWVLDGKFTQSQVAHQASGAYKAQVIRGRC